MIKGVFALSMGVITVEMFFFVWKPEERAQPDVTVRRHRVFSQTSTRVIFYITYYT